MKHLFPFSSCLGGIMKSRSQKQTNKKVPPKDCMVRAISFVKMKWSEDVLCSSVSFWVTWSTLKLWHDVTGNCGFCHCAMDGLLRGSLMQYFQILLQPQGVIQCRPKSQVFLLGMRSSRFWFLITGFSVLHTKNIEEQRCGSRTSMAWVFRCCSQTSSSGGWFGTGSVPRGRRATVTPTAQTQILIQGGLLSLQGRVSNSRIWQVLSNCHWKSVTQEEHCFL